MKLEAAKVMKPRSELNLGFGRAIAFWVFRLGRDRVEFERCCLTRRRGGAEKHAENIFSGLASVLARLRRKVKTCERGDSGDRTASQRRLTLGWKADQRSARRIPQLVWCISMLAGGGKTGTQYKISANFPVRPA